MALYVTVLAQTPETYHQSCNIESNECIEEHILSKERKDISGSRGTGGKLEASVPTLGAGDALELRAPSAKGGNPRQPTTASTIAAKSKVHLRNIFRRT